MAGRVFGTESEETVTPEPKFFLFQEGPKTRLTKSRKKICDSSCLRWSCCPNQTLYDDIVGCQNEFYAVLRHFDAVGSTQEPSLRFRNSRVTWCRAPLPR
jgi:hypothetical protein